MPSKTSVYDKWVDLLLDKEAPRRRGTDVVNEMRKHYESTAKENGRAYNPCTLRSKVSEVKKRVLRAKPNGNQGNRHPKYEQDMKDVVAKATKVGKTCVQAVESFAKLPLRDQATQQRKLDHFPDVGVASALAKVRILPEHMHTFHVGDETERCQFHSESALLSRETVNVSAVAMCNYARSILDSIQQRKPHAKAGADVAPQAVATALLLACGRRMTEVYRVQSTFGPLVEASGAIFPYGCIFGGQLKTSHEIHNTAYKLPLLVTYEAFSAGLKWLRAWQVSGENDMEELRGLSNEKVGRRYQPGMSNYLKENEVGGKSGGEVHAHLLRAIYVRCVLEMFDWKPHNKKRIAKYCLGHRSLGATAHYEHVELEELEHDNARALRELLPEKVRKFPITADELSAREESVSVHRRKAPRVVHACTEKKKR
ncbi:MAG: hypothetical protein CMP83_08430 [Gammaproteobacteria bacterium]|nr:hypothetical protein [Gammaproteobacteria bacterium]